MRLEGFGSVGVWGMFMMTVRKRRLTETCICTLAPRRWLLLFRDNRIAKQHARLQNKQINTGGIAMGKKKLSTNPKVEEARQKKEEAKTKSQAKQKQQQEDAYWAQHANPTAKRDVKREEEMRKKEEARRKKEEARRLAQEEEAELARIGKKKQAPTKVTRREIDQLKMNQRNAQEALSQEKEMQRKKTVGVDEYAAHLDIEIDNRKEAVVDARSLDDAVSQLSIGSQEVDRHPEKYGLDSCVCCVFVDEYNVPCVCL